MTSDGIVDQVGGERRRGFGKRRFKEMILAFQDLPLEQQKQQFLKTFAEYQGNETRRDDVSLLGFKM